MHFARRPIVSRRVLGCISVWLIATAGVAAAEFWDTKPFLDWSDREAEKVMAESPWAALVSVALPPRLPQPSDGGGGGGRGGGGGDERSFGPGPTRVRVTISWRSALPVKQAMLRTQVGQRGALSPEGQKLLSQDEPFYVVALQGLPPQYSRGGDGKTIESFLRRNGKPPIPAEQAGSQLTRGGALLMIGFPKTDPVTLEDGDVEFDVKLDQIEIKKKFKLKEMVFGGKLEL